MLASIVPSSVVGTMAAKMIMQGFVGFHVPVWMRRVVTMVPAFVVVALGLEATHGLILSQLAKCCVAGSDNFGSGFTSRAG
ncbi:divalent metal cation transporter [Paraburkholderia phymatum]|uniref:divalent metal cation transporter n=1 Tax=Paraburkholderia phymatum TaxID=148447 RepID=UPI003F750026